MHIRTEDLLKIRDGEPVDAKIRVAVDSDDQLKADLDYLQETQNALQSLPALDPPSGIWESIAETSFDSSNSSARQWPLRSMIAATLAAVVVLAVIRSPQPPDFSETILETNTEIADADSIQRAATSTYDSLVAESEDLERQLNQIGYQPKLISAGTMSTIVSLEDEIALLDAQLMYARTLQPMQTEALWETRVGLMDALVNVRYTHSQLSGF